MRPNDAEAKRKAVECNKIVKKVAFEKAISVETKSIADSIDFESMGAYNLSPCGIFNFITYF